MTNYPTEANANSKISAFGDIQAQMIAGLPILKIRDTVKKSTEPAFDIVDEAIYHMRTNIFMREFPAKTGADRLVIYLTFYGMKCLKFIAKNKDRAKCQTEFDAWNLKPFPVPGDGSFIISSYVTQPDEKEKPQLTEYFKKLRIEMGNRLLAKVFEVDPKVPDKWWICFSNKKFLDKEMQN